MFPISGETSLKRLYHLCQSARYDRLELKSAAFPSPEPDSLKKASSSQETHLEKRVVTSLAMIQVNLGNHLYGDCYAFYNPFPRVDVPINKESSPLKDVNLGNKVPSLLIDDILVFMIASLEMIPGDGTWILSLWETQQNKKDKEIYKMKEKIREWEDCLKK